MSVIVPLDDNTFPSEIPFVFWVFVSADVIVTTPPDSVIVTFVPAVNANVSSFPNVLPPAVTVLNVFVSVLVSVQGTFTTASPLSLNWIPYVLFAVVDVVSVEAVVILLDPNLIPPNVVIVAVERSIVPVLVIVPPLKPVPAIISVTVPALPPFCILYNEADTLFQSSM